MRTYHVCLAALIGQTLPVLSDVWDPFSLARLCSSLREMSITQLLLYEGHSQTQGVLAFYSVAAWLKQALRSCARLIRGGFAACRPACNPADSVCLFFAVL